MFRTFRTALLGGASAIILVSASYAADMVEPAQAPQPAAAGMNWSGFYVGVGGGFGAVGYNTGIGFGNIGGGGVFGELTAGYDHMLTERLLLGGFIDTHLGTIGPELKAAFGGPSEKIINNYGFDVGVRLGYLLNGSTLGYVLGGYTWQQIKASGGGVSEHENLDGYMLGLGMETAISNNWSIKTEYRYGRYSGDVAGEELKPSTHTFHIAANYRFGANGTAPAIASPAYDWSGFYLGASVGAGEAVNDTTLAGAFNLNGLTGDGIFGELNAGYDHDFGNFVAGLMVDGNYSGIKTDFLGVGHLKSDYGFDILGRIGMKVNPSTLAYVLGGYSWGHFKAELPGISYGWGSSGYSVGGGLETAISTNTTLGIEYRYAQFSDKDISSGLGAPPGLLKVEPSSHTVRVGLKYKFN
ncbi:MAG: outer membrane beta-barrel protein [Rhizobiales bacterium]|nr:outer membrane beta-barrel protein [Hyphomicrobiales bacterium]